MKRLSAWLLALLIILAAAVPGVAVSAETAAGFYGAFTAESPVKEEFRGSWVSLSANGPDSFEKLAGARIDGVMIATAVYLDSSVRGFTENGDWFCLDFPSMEKKYTCAGTFEGSVRALSFDYAQSALFGLAVSGETAYLAEIGTADGFVKLLCPVSLPEDEPAALTVSPDGTRYLLGYSGTLYVPDTETGECAALGSTGLSLNTSADFGRQAMCWDFSGGRLLLGASCAADCRLYTVDVSGTDCTAKEYCAVSRFSAPAAFAALISVPGEEPDFERTGSAALSSVGLELRYRIQNRESPELSVSCGNGLCGLAEPQWETAPEGGDWRPLAGEEPVRAGRRYRARIRVSAADGYLFRDDLTVSVSPSVPFEMSLTDDRTVCEICADFGAAQAARTLTCWDFETDTDGWLFADADGDTLCWELCKNSGEAFRGEGFLKSASFDGTAPLTPDNLAVSPAVALPEKCAKLSLGWAAGSFGSILGKAREEHYEVFVFTGERVGGLQELSALLNESSPVFFETLKNGKTGYETRETDLTEYAGQTVWFVFRHCGTEGQYELLLDDVTVLAEEETYRISFDLPEGAEAAPVDCTQTVYSGDGFRFAVRILTGWDPGEDFRVSANGVCLPPEQTPPEESGFEEGGPAGEEPGAPENPPVPADAELLFYGIDAVSEDTVITVTGLEEVPCAGLVFETNGYALPAEPFPEKAECGKAIGVLPEVRFFMPGVSFLGWTFEGESVDSGWIVPNADSVTLCLRWKIPFTDTPENSWFYSAADFCYMNGLMSGTSEEAFVFEPFTKVSRAMVASILYRMGGSPADVEYKGTFTDVPANMWFTVPVEWCAQNGLAAGKGDGLFDPNGNVTRQELSVFLKKLAEHLGKNTFGRNDLSAFPDADSVPEWALENVRWAVDAGFISGKSSDGQILLSPADTATRAELASILMRFSAYLAEAPDYTAPLFAESSAFTALFPHSSGEITAVLYNETAGGFAHGEPEATVNWNTDGAQEDRLYIIPRYIGSAVNVYSITFDGDGTEYRSVEPLFSETAEDGTVIFAALPRPEGAPCRYLETVLPDGSRQGFYLSYNGNTGTPEYEFVSIPAEHRE